MAQTPQVAREAVLIAAVEAVSEELYKNVTSVFKTVLRACYATEDDLGRAVQESILDQLFCESCESYALLAVENRRAIRGDLLQWVTDRIRCDSDAILGRHFGFNAKGYYVKDVDNLSRNSWRAFDHIKIAGLFNFNRALSPFRQKVSDAMSAGLNRAAILIALGRRGVAQAMGSRRETKLGIEVKDLNLVPASTGKPTEPAHPVLSDWIVNQALEDLERKYLSDQQKKLPEIESSSIGNPKCAAMSYRVERLKQYTEEMECVYEAEIEAGRLSNTAGLWAAVYAQKILPSVSAKINSLVWNLAHRLWLTGRGGPGEKAAVEEAQRELSRLKAGLEHKLANACEHTAAAGDNHFSRSAPSPQIARAGGAKRHQVIESAISEAPMLEKLIFVRRKGETIAVPNFTHKALLNTYGSLSSTLGQVRALVIAKNGRLSIKDLKNRFGRTELGKAADDEDWTTWIEIFAHPRTPSKAAALVFLEKKTGLKRGTIKKCCSIARKARD